MNLVALGDLGTIIYYHFPVLRSIFFLPTGAVILTTSFNHSYYYHNSKQLSEL